jgi:hypothetical protein
MGASLVQILCKDLTGPSAQYSRYLNCARHGPADADRHYSAVLAFSPTDALEFTIGGLFLLVLMRLILRSLWLVIPLWMCLVMPVALWAASFNTPFVFSDLVLSLIDDGCPSCPDTRYTRVALRLFASRDNRADRPEHGLMPDRLRWSCSWSLITLIQVVDAGV